MNLVSASKLLSEAMIVGEHPEEPMVILGISKLNENFPFDGLNKEKLIQLTANFLQETPRLVGHFDLKCDGTPFVSGDKYNEMAKLAWSCDSLTEDAFKKQFIDPAGDCLVRFKLSRESGFMVAVHHGLLDGRGLFKLQHDFLKLLILPEVSIQDEKSYQFKKRQNKLFNLVSYFAFVLDKVKEILNPPLILGNKEDFAGKDTYFYTHHYDSEKIKSALKTVRRKIPQATLNDVVLTALHLILQRRFNNGDSIQRQAIMMPIDLRRHGKYPSFENLSSGVNINVYKSDFKTVEKLTTAIVNRSKKSIGFNFDIYTLNFLKRIKKLGILNESRNMLLSRGLPRRCFKGSKNFWRFSSTVIFANMGTLRIEKSMRDVLKEIMAYPAIISPTSLAITAFVYKDLQLNFRCSSSIFQKKELIEFATNLESIFEEIETNFRENDHE